MNVSKAKWDPSQEDAVQRPVKFEEINRILEVESMLMQEGEDEQGQPRQQVDIVGFLMERQKFNRLISYEECASSAAPFKSAHACNHPRPAPNSSYYRYLIARDTSKKLQMVAQQNLASSMEQSGGSSLNSKIHTLDLLLDRPASQKSADNMSLRSTGNQAQREQNQSLKLEDLQTVTNVSQETPNETAQHVQEADQSNNNSRSSSSEHKLVFQRTTDNLDEILKACAPERVFNQLCSVQDTLAEQLKLSQIQQKQFDSFGNHELQRLDQKFQLEEQPAANNEQKVAQQPETHTTFQRSSFQ